MRIISESFSSVAIQGKTVVSQFLPSVPVEGAEVFAAGHGSHMTGIIAGKVDPGNTDAPLHDRGICGLAPDAWVYMIKAFEGAASTKEMLLRALESAKKIGVDIVNLSLKIAQNPNPLDAVTQKLMREFTQFPYTVVASGNANGEQVNRLPYPARFGGLIDVGSFGYDDKGHYPILSFSQYERGVGPKFVMPGFNILSSGLVPHQQTDSMYVFMSGTSPATAVMTGALALIVGEFKQHFTRDQIMQVVAHSGIFLQNSSDWVVHSLLGTLDVRLCLFTLHVLKQLKAARPVQDQWLFWIRKVQKALFAPLRDMGIASPRKNFGLLLKQSIARGKRFYAHGNLDEEVAKIVRQILK